MLNADPVQRIFQYLDQIESAGHRIYMEFQPNIIKQYEEGIP